MKKTTLTKILAAVLILAMVFTMAACGGSGNSGNSADANEQLVALGQAFENLDMMKEYLEYDGYKVESSVDGDTLKIAMGMDDYMTESSFTLDGDILTMDGGMTDEQIFSAIIIALAKAVMDGNDEDLATAALTHNSATEMTLEDNGILIDVNNGVFQMDLSKPVTLKDMSDVYVTLDDLGEFDPDFQSFAGHAGLIGYSINIDNYGGDSYLTVAEPGELTESAYKSLLSLVEFVYGKDAADDFAAKYPEIADASFDNYVVTINPEHEEESMFGEEYQVLELVVKGE
ncbi:MAG: hypothetical protein IJT40_03465 [Firmicutes bacterium]|nr:hypothetical protein [Bacillota bacterium]